MWSKKKYTFNGKKEESMSLEPKNEILATP
jgi:hypothetical protein